MPARRARRQADRAWFVDQGGGSYEDTGGGINLQLLLIAGDDLTSEEDIFPDQRSEFYCERFILEMRWRCTARAEPLSLPYRWVEMALAVYDTAVAVNLADATNKTTDSMWEAAGPLWDNRVRILQQWHQIAYADTSRPERGQLVAVTDGATAATALKPGLLEYGPGNLTLDLESKFSLHADTDLYLVMQEPPAVWDSTWSVGDTVSIDYAFKSLWRRRRS